MYKETVIKECTCDNCGTHLSNYGEYPYNTEVHFCDKVCAVSFKALDNTVSYLIEYFNDEVREV